MVGGERDEGWSLRLRRGQRLASCRFLGGHLSWIRCGWIVGFWVGIFSDFFSLKRQGKGGDGKVVYMTYTIFSKIPMMNDDDDEKKRRGEENS